MRILIFGHARSGSSVLQEYLSKTLSLENLYEPFTYGTDRNILTMLREKDQYVVKITSGNFFQWGIDEIDLSIYDQVWITERENKNDVLASVYIADKTKNYGKQEKQKFTITKEFLIRWQTEMKFFYQFQQRIMKEYPDYKKMSHTEIMQAMKDSDMYVPSEMDYSIDCENYNDMREPVAYIIDKLETEFGK
jgi:hypothetical protein